MHKDLLGAYARETGRLVSRPNSIEANPDMAAVAVINSLWTSI